jgi:hypothetical protein
MAKRNKIICLDVDLVEQLSNINASQLINELLKDYFNAGGKLAKKELIDKIAQLHLSKDKIDIDLIELEYQLNKLNDKEKILKEIYKNIPDDILDDFKQFPNMTITALANRFSEIYKKKYHILYEELEKAYNEYYGKNNKS